MEDSLRKSNLSFTLKAEELGAVCNFAKTPKITRDVLQNLTNRELFNRRFTQPLTTERARGREQLSGWTSTFSDPAVKPGEQQSRHAPKRYGRTKG